MKRQQTRTPKHNKSLPIHIACSTGNKGALKSIISTLPKRGLEIRDGLGRTPLILTVSKNHFDCCTILLKAGVTVDNTDNAGQTALHIAASKGLLPFVKILLSYKASWIQRDYSGATALHMAAIHPNVKGLSMVLKHVRPAEIDIQDSTSKTVLHWGAAYVCNDNLKLLLTQGANPCIPDENGQTPLHWAAANCHQEALPCVKTLLKNKPGLIDWQDYEGRSPLHVAVTNGTEEVVYYLASWHNCNIDIIDNNFLTPLHYAAKRGLAEKADILLKKRASHLSIDDNGAMPLHYAAYNDHAETVEVFVNKAYICDEPDHFGRSALVWAAVKNSEAALQVLASAYETTYADKNGFTALHAAAMYGNVSAIELLISAGMRVDSKDKHGLTPFLKACEFGRTKSAKALLRFGANMCETDLHSRSALHWCAMGGHAYLSDVLIKFGADFNSKDDLGMTPLHYVSVYGDFVNCTCVLVESGADLTIVDVEGKTALHNAILNERVAMVKYLCEHGANVNAMFLLYKDWVTPYDCAMFRCNVKIAVEIEKFGGIQVKALKIFAVKQILTWYKKKRKTRTKKFAVSSLKKKCNSLCSWHTKQKFTPVSVCQLCSPIDLKKTDLVFICNECFHRYAEHPIYKEDHLILGKQSAYCYNVSSFNSAPGYKLLKLCENPSTCSGLIRLSSIAYKKIYYHIMLQEKATTVHFCNIRRDTAARVIQKTYRRYLMKKKFSKVRNEVEKSYISQTERTAAQAIWQLRLQEFLQNFID